MHQIGADQWRRDMKNLVLAGALLAVLASPAFAEEPYSANDPYNNDAKHLNAQSQDVQTSLQARPARSAQSTFALSHTKDGPNGTVIRDGQVVGQDPDPAVRPTIGADFDQQGYD